MANPKWKEWEEEDKLILLEGWAMMGLTDEQIAHNMGIGKTTYYDMKNKSPKIANSLKKSKEVADLMVVNALFQNALEGNTTAQIFWLKNRMSKYFRDKVEVEEDKDESNSGIVMIPEVKDK